MRRPENVNHAVNNAQMSIFIACGTLERKRQHGMVPQPARSGEVHDLSLTERVGQLPGGPRVITQVPGTIRIDREIERQAPADHPITSAKQDAPRSRRR